MAYQINSDWEQEGKFNFKPIDWEDKGQAFFSGKAPVDPEKFLKEARNVGGLEYLPGFFRGGLKGIIVSPEFKEFAEAHDGVGANQYMPITLYRENGEPYPNQPYYVLNIRQSFDAVIVAKSELRWSDQTLRGGRPNPSYKPDRVPSLYRDRGGGSKLVMSTPEIGERCVWKPLILLKGDKYLSNLIVDHFGPDYFRAMKLVKIEEIDEPWDRVANLREWAGWREGAKWDSENRKWIYPN